MQIIIIGIAAYWFAALSGIPKYVSNVLFRFGIKKKHNTNTDTTFAEYSTPIRLYPFDCEKCLAFWLGIVYFPFNFEGVMVSFCCSFVAIVTGLLINKLR